MKSTDAQSIKVNQKDIRMLEYNAEVAHKLPIFAIQFLNTGEVWLMAKPEDFTSVAEYISTNQISKAATSVFDDVEEVEDVRQRPRKKIGSSKSSRDAFYKERDKRFDKTKNAR